MPNYNLNLADVPDGTAGAALVAADGQTHSNGPGFDTINGGMFNTAGGATDGFLVIDEALPDTYSGDLDLTFISAWGAAGLSLSSNADFTESIIIQVNAAGTLTVQHRTIAGGFGPNLGSADAIAGLSSGDPMPRVHYEVSPTHLLVTLGGVTVFDDDHTTNSETFNIQAYRATAAASSTSGYHVNSNVLVDPADNAKTYVEGPNILLLPANVNKNYADGEYDVVTSIINNDATTASSSSTMSVGFSMSPDGPMVDGTDHVVTVSNPPVVPTDVNTTYSNGAVSLVPVVTGDNPYTLTFPIAYLDKVAGNYTWTLDIDGNALVSDALAYSMVPHGVEHYFGPLSAKTGEYEDPAFDGWSVGDNVYAIRQSGDTTYPPDISIGAFPPGVWQIKNQDQVDSRWNAFGTLTIPEPVTNNEATGAPTVSGTAEEGQVLTLDASSIADDDGLGTFSYQWLRDDVAIAGATGTTYTLVQADVGAVIKASVSFTDNEGNAEGPLISAGTATVTQLYFVVIDSIVPARTSAVVEFSYAGTQVSGYEYNIGGGWLAASTPLTIPGLTEATLYSLSIRPLNAQNSYVGEPTTANFTTQSAIDNTPNSFAFNALSNQARAVFAVSNAITIQGVDAGIDIPLTILSGEYSVSTDGGNSWGNWITTPSNGRLNYQVRVRHLTSSAYNDVVTTTLAAGGVSASFVSTTLPDTVAPVITLVGGNLTMVEGTPWVEPGYSATDNGDGTLPLSAFTVTGTVDTNTPGTYVLTYVAEDSAGNQATTTRTIEVTADIPTDSTAPVISLVGGNIILTEGEAWSEPGYSAIDNVDGDITNAVNITGSVNVNVLGSYPLTYTVTDAANNTSTVTRLVTVVSAVSYPIVSPAPATRTFVAARSSRIEQGEDIYIKQPEEILDYDFDLTEWLEAENDVLPSDNISFDLGGSDVKVESAGLIPGTSRVKVWLSGGSVVGYGKSYPVELTIITAGFRKAQFMFRLVVIDKVH